MSRRPRASFEQRMARRARTMAPGGTIPSESPVIRPKSMAGGVLVEASWVGAGVGTAGDLYWYPVGDAVIAEGDLMVAVCLRNGAGTISLPAGWTSIADGINGNTNYRVGYGLAPSGDPALTSGFTDAQFIRGHVLRGPTAAAVSGLTVEASSSVGIYATPSSVDLAAQAILFTRDAAGTISPWPLGDDYWSSFGFTSGTGSVLALTYAEEGPVPVTAGLVGKASGVAQPCTYVAFTVNPT